MSLSLAGLLDSRLLVLQLGGAAKEAIYRQALGKAPEDGEVYFELRREERPIDPARWLQ